MFERSARMTKGCLIPEGRAVADLLNALNDVVLAGVEVGVVVEPHLDDRDPLPASRLHVMHAGHGADDLLDGVGDRLLDVLDVRARVDGPDGDDRLVDVREQVDRQALQGGAARTTMASAAIRTAMALRTATSVSHMGSRLRP